MEGLVAVYAHSSRKKDPGENAGVVLRGTNRFLRNENQYFGSQPGSMELILGHPRPGHNHIDQRFAIARPQQ
jgi:hypothetical protein